MRFQQKTYLRPRCDVLSPLNPSEQFTGESTANGGSKTKPLDLDIPKNSDFSIFWTQNGGIMVDIGQTRFRLQERR